MCNVRLDEFFYQIVQLKGTTAVGFIALQTK